MLGPMGVCMGICLSNTVGGHSYSCPSTSSTYLCKRRFRRFQYKSLPFVLSLRSYCILAMSTMQDLLASFSTSLFVQPFVNAVLPGRLVVPAITSPHPRPTSGPPAAACVAGPVQAVGKSVAAARVQPVKFFVKLVLLDDGEIQVDIESLVNDSFNHEVEVLVETSSKSFL